MNDSHDLIVDQCRPETQRCIVDGHHLPIDQCYLELHSTHVNGHFLAGSHLGSEPQFTDAASHNLTVSHAACETQMITADGHCLPTDHGSNEIQGQAVGGHLLAGSHAAADTHDADAASHNLTISQWRLETHKPFADGHHLPTDHHCHGTHCRPVGGQPPVVPPNSPTKGFSQPDRSSSGGWVELRICADLFHRAQQERIAVANLLRTSDHDMFGPHLAQLEATEHAARLMLRRCYRRVVPNSLRALQKAEAGLGEDSFARILGHLGDPYIATPHWWEGTGANRTLMVGEPYVRTIGQLWQYCGHGAPGRVTKGMTAEQLAGLGNPTMKMLVHIQAEFCMKQKGRYRLLYETIRSQVEDKKHTVPCVRCGPSGKPAQDGTPWAKGHQHAHALRVLGKEILRDMWLARHLEETA